MLREMKCYVFCHYSAYPFCYFVKSIELIPAGLTFHIKPKMVGEKLATRLDGKRSLKEVTMGKEIIGEMRCQSELTMWQSFASIL